MSEKEQLIKEEITLWNTKINDAEVNRDQFKPEYEKNYTAVWGDDFLKDGKRSGNNDSGTSKSKKYQYDKLLSFIKTEIPTLVLYRPEIFLSPTQRIIRTFQDQQQLVALNNAVKQYEEEVNSILNDMDSWEYEIKSGIADGHCAYGVVKVISNPVFVPNPEADVPIGNDMEGKLIYPPEENYNGSKFDVIRVDPLKFLIDPKCKNDPNKAKWMGEEISKTLKDLKDSDLYDSKVVAKIEENFSQQGKNDDEIELTIYEIYDRINEKIIVLCEGYNDDFLRYEDTPPNIDKDPYSILKFNEIPGQFYPKPDISSGRQLQEDEIDVRQWMKKQAKKSVPKMGIRGKLVTNEDERRKLLDPVDEVVNCNPSDTFQINTDLKLGTAVGDYSNVLQSDFTEVMGQSSQARGLTDKAKFATEVEVAELHGNVRQQDKINTVSNWLCNIIEKIVFHIKYGGYGNFIGLPLDVDFDIEIDIESKTPKSKAIERKQYTELGMAYPLVFESPTFLKNLLQSFSMREIDTIIEEVQQAQALKQQMEEERLAIQQMGKQPMGGEANTNTPVEAGTEGVEPGQGMMPSGAVV